MLILFNDLPCPVCGAVLADYQFKVKIGLLHEHALDRLRDECLVIVRDHTDTNLHGETCVCVSTMRDTLLRDAAFAGGSWNRGPIPRIRLTASA